MCIHEIQQLLILDLGPACLLPLGQSDPSTSLNNHFGINKVGSGHNPRRLGFLESLLLILERGKTFGIRILDCDSFKSQHQGPLLCSTVQLQIKALISMRRFS